MDPGGGRASDHSPLHGAAKVADFRAIVFSFLADHGWFLLIGVAVLAFLWQKYIAEYWSRCVPTASQVPIAVVKKDDDASSILARHEAMLAARQRMQEEQNRLSALAREEMEKREEEKRRQKIEEFERQKQGGSYRSKAYVPEQQTPSSASHLKKPQAKKPLRPNDYSPLSGSGGGSGYRPSRRGFGGGGGGGG